MIAAENFRLNDLIKDYLKEVAEARIKLEMLSFTEQKLLEKKEKLVQTEFDLSES